MTGIATKVRDLITTPTQVQSLYRMEPPLEGHEYVAVSAVNGWAHETYIFPANAAGDITDWSEMEGSIKGTMDHAEALRGAGYEVQS